MQNCPAGGREQLGAARLVAAAERRVERTVGQFEALGVENPDVEPAKRSPGPTVPILQALLPEAA